MLLAFWITRGARPPAPPASRYARFLDDGFTIAQLRVGFAHAYYLRRAALEYNQRLRRQLRELLRLPVTSTPERDGSEMAGDEDENEEVDVVEASEEQQDREGDSPIEKAAHAAAEQIREPHGGPWTEPQNADAASQQAEGTPGEPGSTARPATTPLSPPTAEYSAEETNSSPHSLPQFTIATPSQAWQPLKNLAPGELMSEGGERAFIGLNADTTAAPAVQLPAPLPLRWALPWRDSQLAQEENPLSSSCTEYTQPHHAALQKGWSTGADPGFEEVYREGHGEGYEKGLGDGWTWGIDEGYDAGNLHGDGWEERAKCAGPDEHEEIVAEEMKKVWLKEKEEMLSMLKGRLMEELKGMIIGACFERDGWIEKNVELEWRIGIARERRSGRSLIIKLRAPRWGQTE